MIQQSLTCIKLTVSEMKSLLAIKDWTGDMWNHPPNDEIQTIKAKIRTQLGTVQKKCAYCGLKLKGTSNGQIEHIAPKAYYRYPQFTFTFLNLVMACGYCNGFDKKSTVDTIDSKHKLYKRCKFSIVHPYFDNPELFYEWDDKGVEILVSIKDAEPDIQEKAKNSIEIFGLAEPTMSELRAQQVRFEEYKNKFHLSNDDENLLEEAIE